MTSRTFLVYLTVNQAAGPTDKTISVRPAASERWLLCGIQAWHNIAAGQIMLWRMGSDATLQDLSAGISVAQYVPHRPFDGFFRDMVLGYNSYLQLSIPGMVNGDAFVRAIVKKLKAFEVDNYT